MNVIDRIVLGLRAGEIDVEDEFRVRLARHEKKTHGIAAHFVDQIADRHIAAGALADLHFLAAAHHRDHLMQNVVGIPERNADAERLQTRAHAGDRAVMIGALHVDRLRKAALEFRDVIGDVGHEIRVSAIGLAHHAILVVAVVGRA